MKKTTLFVAFLFALIGGLMAQETKVISGVIKDKDGYPIPGATVVVDNETSGTFTNFDGKFEIKSNKTEGTFKISSIGFISKEIPFQSLDKNIEVVLKSSSVDLDDVLIVANRAIDRKTPVAYSTVSKEEIELTLGNQEFVEVLKSTPGAFTTRGSGGFGDGEITLRGFNSENVAVVINGIPINDFVDGRVFWSNWAGIGNVTASTQTQRGLGASKLAIPSIGGTQNIITETAEAQQGGQFKYGVGNNGYTKYGLKLSTGLMKNGLAATAYVDRVVGEGYVDGTPFESVSYFGSISKRFNSNHKLIFTAVGAPQKHGTRFERFTIQQTRENPNGIRANADFGIRNGEIFSVSRNSFHKPLFGLTHYWNVDDETKLTTSLYYSNGNGGITFDQGDVDTSASGLNDNEYRIGDYGPLDIDKIARENQQNGASISYLVSSINKHDWFGALSVLNKELNDSFDITIGLDAKYGAYERYREITDLLGGRFAERENGNDNNSKNELLVGDKFLFHDENTIRSLGTFGQLEYDYDQVSAFVAANVSNTQYRRKELFTLATDPNRTSDWVNFTGFGAKTGANYRIDSYNNIFANVGYFERAPFFNAIWPTNNNTQTNENAENQKIFSAELGYGLRTEKLAANINVYRTLWKDRTETRSRNVDVQNPDTGEIETERIFDNITGINALHQGIEVDFEYRPFNFLTLKGFASLGDWVWQDDVNVVRLDENQQVEDEFNVLVKDLPVGRSAQTTAGLSLRLNATPQTTFLFSYNFYDRYYADFDPSDRVVTDITDTEQVADARKDPYQVPYYNLFDATFQHKFKISGLNAKIIANMYNVFDTDYITRADDNGGDLSNATVFFGPGRTFSVSTIINF